MKKILCLMLVCFGSVSAVAQVRIPEKTVSLATKQNGWHLDSVQILFDGSGVINLNTRPIVRAFFQGTHTDVSGKVYCVPGTGMSVTLEDSAAVAKVLQATVSLYSVREILRDGIWRQVAPRVGVTDSALTATWGIIVTVPK